jgi:hypothetical protein
MPVARVVWTLQSRGTNVDAQPGRDGQSRHRAEQPDHHWNDSGQHERGQEAQPERYDDPHPGALHALLEEGTPLRSQSRRGASQILSNGGSGVGGPRGNPGRRSEPSVGRPRLPGLRGRAASPQRCGRCDACRPRHRVTGTRGGVERCRHRQTGLQATRKEIEHDRGLLCNGNLSRSRSPGQHDADRGDDTHHGTQSGTETDDRRHRRRPRYGDPARAEAGRGAIVAFRTLNHDGEPTRAAATADDGD